MLETLASEQDNQQGYLIENSVQQYLLDGPQRLRSSQPVELSSSKNQEPYREVMTGGCDIV